MTDPATAAQRAEELRPIAESSATAYVDLIASEGAAVDPHRAFVDGLAMLYLTNPGENEMLTPWLTRTQTPWAWAVER